LINAGGDIYCLGDKQGEPWRVAVQDPRGEGFTDYLDLRDKAVATSGDYEQYFLRDDKRYAHVLDPATGYPTDSGVASATVIAPDCLTADALATSALVMGKDRAEALAKKFPGVQIKIIEAQGK
jgi:thiamine biosynthesis lipoprotein